MIRALARALLWEINCVVRELDVEGFARGHPIVTQIVNLVSLSRDSVDYAFLGSYNNVLNTTARRSSVMCL